MHPEASRDVRSWRHRCLRKEVVKSAEDGEKCMAQLGDLTSCMMSFFFSCVPQNMLEMDLLTAIRFAGGWEPTVNPKLTPPGFHHFSDLVYKIHDISHLH